MKIFELSQKERLINTFRRHKIIFAAIFGSRAKGIAKRNSDYDLLVEFDPKAHTSLFDMVKTQDDLGDTLGGKVDLVTLNALHPLMRKEVLSSMKVLYDSRSR